MASKSRTSSIQAQNASAESSLAATPTPTVYLSAVSYQRYYHSSTNANTFETNGNDNTPADNIHQLPHHTAYQEAYFYPGQFDSTVNYVPLSYQPELGDDDLGLTNGYNTPGINAPDIVHEQNNNYGPPPQVSYKAQPGSYDVQINEAATDDMTLRWSSEQWPLEEATAGMRRNDSRRQHNRKLKTTLADVDQKLKAKKR